MSSTARVVGPRLTKTTTIVGVATSIQASGKHVTTTGNLLSAFTAPTRGTFISNVRPRLFVTTAIDSQIGG